VKGWAAKSFTPQLNPTEKEERACLRSTVLELKVGNMADRLEVKGLHPFLLRIQITGEMI